jgi:DNA polymerase elongation subunit (family B)
MTGVEAIRSSTPSFCRTKLKEAISLIMNSTEDEMIKYIAETKKEFFALSPEEVSFPKSVNDVTKYMSKVERYKKGTPIQTRGSILYNELVKTKKLDKKYSIIKNGEKIKFCYLKLPNPIHENVISFIQKLPPEFDVHPYVDYKLQFEKTFLIPLKSILDVIGWHTERVSTLTSFFA